MRRGSFGFVTRLQSPAEIAGPEIRGERFGPIRVQDQDAAVPDVLDEALARVSCDGRVAQRPDEAVCGERNGRGVLRYHVEDLAVGTVRENALLEVALRVCRERVAEDGVDGGVLSAAGGAIAFEAPGLHAWRESIMNAKGV